MNPASVQLRIDLESVEHDVACFGATDRAHCLAVLDVTGVGESLASADDAKQEELLAGRAHFLNAQLADFQVLVRAEPVDLTAHVERIQQRALGLHEALQRLAQEYAVFIRTLAQLRTLLERRCYVVLPAPDPGVSVGLGSVRRLLGRKAGPHAGVAETDVARHLAARCDQVARDLSRSGLQTRRLTGLAYAQLAHRCWAPEQARAQRFQREIGDYTALVVSAERTAGRSTRAARTSSGDGADETRLNRRLSRDERLLALGARTLADLVAPGACEVRQDYLQLDGQYARVLAITAYPRTVTAGSLAPLVESDLPIEVSAHVRPLESAAMVRSLSTHVARLQAARLARLRGERIADPEQEIALEDAERLRERLQRGEERVFAVSLYVLVRGASRAELELLTRRVEMLLDGMLAQARRARWQQERGFRSCLPEGRDQLLVTRNLDTSALAARLPFVGSSLSMERGVLYGISARTQSPIIVDPFDDRFDNYHLTIMAPSGSGKSFFVKLLALRSLINGTDCLVIDPEDEYRRVADALADRWCAWQPPRANRSTRSTWCCPTRRPRSPARLARWLRLSGPWSAGWNCFCAPPYREFFASRIVVPELRQGRPMWFIGRTLEQQPSRRPKYLSLPGQRPLLGLEAVQGQRVVYVCEGPFDWLAARAWGLPACCLCGTHAPPDRLPALDRAVAV